ncbi:Aspercryptin biosynthesis cluster-specific transcription regulator atnN [Colletotrichum siamense]|uniref:Aspercryptin biosynthesis cluster-specific transcription regulator atnN n=1 Tax=Colletotrichum siamense TaxID=690259 RepID=UPI001873071C|nr:Aspercryptin biosynthesis cluster-specific transcription regulator atnN [Colletotrichum siamense]KAF5515269.1 Aspercryptin biosynthesis cluster-specific transcription regulator atnN [Colletotrichum siamense]
MSKTNALVMSFALEHRPRLTRTSKPKSRNGCTTCRYLIFLPLHQRRHFKCDETKPACLACLKYQGFCTGYTPAKTKPLAKPPPQRLVYPKLAVGQAKNKLFLEPSYASLTFSDQLEKDHFDYWLAFSQASCLFRSDFVAQIIPQLSWDDSVIKHLAIAIGAAALGGNTREQRICGKGKFHKDALVHYGKALNMLCSSPMSSERTLLACLMFITFESLQGNRAAGLNHINQGFRILDQCHQSLEDERSALLDGISSSFQKFSHQAWALNGLHPQETEKRVPWCCRGRKARYAIDEMPPVFETLEVARRWWAIVRHHIEHHAPLRTKFQVKGSSMTDHPMLSPEDGAPGTLAYIHSFTRYLDQWDAAFRPLAIKVHNNDENYRLRALSLRIQYLYLWAGVRTGSWTDETEAEKITATFRDIVALSRQLLAAEASRPPPRAGEGDVEVFSMDDSPTWPLACAYRVCKASDVQNEVVQLFKQYPRRDGLLDTQAFLVVMEWVERNASAGIIMNMPSPVVDCVVWDDSTVTLQRQLWDPATSEWSDKSIKFSIV